MDLTGITDFDASGLSIIHGAGADTPGEGGTGFASQIADGLGLTEHNLAIDGTRILVSGVSEDGWGKVYNDLPRTGGSAPFAKLPRLGALMYGINDLATWGPTAYQEPFRHALRAAIARHCASQIFEDTDSSNAYGGDWANSPGLAAGTASGTSKHVGTTGAITVTVPSTFPGGALQFGFQCQTDSIGADFDVRVDGISQGQVFHGFGSLGLQTFIFRATGIEAGAHTVTISISGVDFAGVYDFWGIEPTDAQPVLVFGAYKLPSYASLTFLGHTPTDAEVDGLNSIIEAVCAEFGDNVVFIDTDSIIDKSTELLDDDLLHPSQAGHDAIAAATLAIVTPPVVEAPLASYATAAELEAYIPGGSGLTTDDAEALLVRVSREVDRYCGSWPIDENTGLRFMVFDDDDETVVAPWLRARQVTALSNATCAQAEYHLLQGEDFFIADQTSSASGPDISRTGTFTRIGPKVAEELVASDLLRRTARMPSRRSSWPRGWDPRHDGR